MDTEQNPSPEQLELQSMLVEGAAPDAYIVIPVEELSRQVQLSATATAKRYRGEIRPGQFELHLMRSLMHVGALIDTKYLRDQEPS